MMTDKKSSLREGRRAATGAPSPIISPKPTAEASSPVATSIPSTHPAPAPISAFQIDKPEPEKRGPGRPPKVCPTCGKLASECKGHAEEKFSIGEGTCKGLITLVSQLTAYSFALSTGAPAIELAKIWDFTEGEKAILVPPTAELINKNAPEWLLKYETEIKLGMIAIPLVIAKLAATHALVKVYKESQKQETSSPSPAAGARETSPARAAAA